MNGSIGTFAIVYGAILAQMIVFVACSWGLAAALGARVIDVMMGAPGLVRFRAGGVAVRIGLVPGASLGFAGRGNDCGDDPRGWRRLPLARRLAIVVGPWLVSCAIAVALLGGRALTSIAHGFVQVLYPLDPTPLVRRFVELAAHAPMTVVLGLVLAKLTAMNLLPLPSLAGGGVIDELRGGAPARGGWTMAGTLFVMLYIAGRFLYALVRVSI